AHVAKQARRPDIIKVGERVWSKEAARIFAVITDVHHGGNANLTEVIDTGGLLGFCLRAGNGRQEHRRQYCDDGDNNKELNQGEGPSQRLAQTRMPNVFHLSKLSRYAVRTFGQVQSAHSSAVALLQRYRG